MNKNSDSHFIFWGLIRNPSIPMYDLKSQAEAMADSTPPFGTTLWNGVSTSTWWKPLVLNGSLILLILFFGPCILNCLSHFVMSHVDAIKLQMVMEIKPKMTYQGSLDHPSGEDLTVILHDAPTQLGEARLVIGHSLSPQWHLESPSLEVGTEVETARQSV